MNEDLKKQIDEMVKKVSFALEALKIKKASREDRTCVDDTYTELLIYLTVMIALDNTISEEDSATISYYFGSNYNYLKLNELAYGSDYYKNAEFPELLPILPILVKLDNAINKEISSGDTFISYSVLYFNTYLEITKEMLKNLRTPMGRGRAYAEKYMKVMADYLDKNLEKQFDNSIVGKNSSNENKKTNSFSVSQKNAILAAKNYLEMCYGYSKEGLIDQLSSEGGDEYPREDAIFAVEYLERNHQVNWNDQAAYSAKSYLDSQPFSRKELFDQLVSEHGEKFTQEQAEFGLKSVGY